MAVEAITTSMTSPVAPAMSAMAGKAKRGHAHLTHRHLHGHGGGQPVVVFDGHAQRRHECAGHARVGAVQFVFAAVGAEIVPPTSDVHW